MLRSTSFLALAAFLLLGSPVALAQTDGVITITSTDRSDGGVLVLESLDVPDRISAGSAPPSPPGRRPPPTGSGRDRSW